jgi:hypothetical protein
MVDLRHLQVQHGSRYYRWQVDDLPGTLDISICKDVVRRAITLNVHIYSLDFVVDPLDVTYYLELLGIHLILLPIQLSISPTP